MNVNICYNKNLGIFIMTANIFASTIFYLYIVFGWRLYQKNMQVTSTKHINQATIQYYVCISFILFIQQFY